MRPQSWFVLAEEAIMQSRECKLRRFALQIVQQLPETKAEALLVLEFAREVIQWTDTQGGDQVVREVARLVG